MVSDTLRIVKDGACLGWAVRDGDVAILVNSPNGGEELFAGQTFQITWSYEEEIELIEPSEYYLPRILSIDPLTRQTYVAKHTIKVIPKKELAKANESKRVIDNFLFFRLKICEKKQN